MNANFHHAAVETVESISDSGLSGQISHRDRMKPNGAFCPPQHSPATPSPSAHTTERPGSTIRPLLFTFFKMGLLDRLEVFGGYKYCLSAAANTHPYFERIQEPAAVLQM
jgi:hypothetical protein